VSTAAIGVLLVSIPLGTTISELACGFACFVAAIVLLTDRQAVVGALVGPWILIALGWLAMSLAHGTSITGSLGRIWASCPILIVPIVLSRAKPMPWLNIALLSAVPVAILTLVQAGMHWFGPAESFPPAPSGLYSHHLTFVYAFIPIACACMAERKWSAAVLLTTAIVACGALGGIAGMAVAWFTWAAFTMMTKSKATLMSLGVGLVASLGTLGLLGQSDLYQRTVLWTGGAVVATSGGAPAGHWRERIDSVHQQLDPNFFFPHHAHDTFLQLASEAGFASWMALLWGLFIIWKQGRPWVIAIIAGCVFGALSQDLFGDLEVARSCSTWLAIGLLASPRGIKQHTK